MCSLGIIKGRPQDIIKIPKVKLEHLKKDFHNSIAQKICKALSNHWLFLIQFFPIGSM
jgi:hypothetical protein